jgi:Adenosine deaminase
MNQPRLDFVIRAWLHWPERVIDSPRHRAITTVECRRFGFRSHAFRQRLRSEHKDRKLDDIDSACAAIAQLCESRLATGDALLPTLYREWLKDLSIDIAFINNVPAIACGPGSYMTWRRLIDKVDPDALACLMLAVRAQDLDDLAHAEALVRDWPLVFNARDLDLAVLSERGLTDLHLHMTSLWPAALSWQRVLRFRENRGEGKRLKHLATFHQGNLSPAERACVANSAMQESGVPSRLPNLTRLRPEAPSFFYNDPHRQGRMTARSIAEILAPERTMLLRAWYSILTGRDRCAEIEAELDEYIVAKSLFRFLHGQPLEDTNKGLVAFDEVRRAGSRLGMFDQDEAKGGRFFGRRFDRNKSFLLLALRDCRALRQVEVRIAPPAVRPRHLAHAYCKTFLATDRLIRRNLEIAPEKLDVRVALHFKRAVTESPREVARRKAAGQPPTLPLLRKLLEFDRDTATFHDYRYRVSQAVVRRSMSKSAAEDLEALQRFSRVDLASPERGAGPWTIAPYVRLLRGDRDALTLLADERSRTYFPKWVQLYKQKRAHFPIGSPEIRVTCHAGEDFFTLVDGLRHVSEAMTTWDMRQGDALGHCLALWLSPREYLPSLQSVWLPTGVELDSLVWLRSFMRGRDEIPANLRYDLDEEILRLTKHVYGRRVNRDYLGSSDILSLMDARVAQAAKPLLVPRSFAPHNLPATSSGFLDDAQEGHDAAAARLHYDDLFDPVVTALRASKQGPSRLHEKLNDVIGSTQGMLLDEIRKRGITIETNPSSNMRMERIGHPAALPVVMAMLESSARTKVTICTDNPGTYDINIETEYAVMHDALIKKLGAANTAEVLQVLENVRRAGRDLFAVLSANAGATRDPRQHRTAVSSKF